MFPTSFEFKYVLAENLGFYGWCLIWFLWFRLMMVMLLLVIFVVVVLELSVVIFWLQENLWLCVGEGWPNEGGDGDVVFVVDYVALDVVIVVICVGCDGGNHGEVLVILVVVAGWSGDGCVVILVV